MLRGRGQTLVLMGVTITNDLNALWEYLGGDLQHKLI